MADENERDCSPATTNATRPRKVRPEIQIYRPGMMRKGIDITTSGLSSANDSKHRTSVSRQHNRISEINEGQRKGKPEVCCDSRNSNDTESVHSNYGDSGSTTPDATSMCSEFADKSNKVSDCWKSSRSKGFNANKQYYQRNSSDFKCSTSVNEKSARVCDSKQRFRILSQQEKIRNISSRISSPNFSYNSTQSLYDPQYTQGCLNSRDVGRRQENLKSGRAPSPVRFGRKAHQHTERSSMRAEAGQRRNVGNRRRNDSINSTQSECLPQLPDQLRVETSNETQSVAGDALSPSTSYMQLCQSFESIGSFDWSKEMEFEYNAKHSEEQEKVPSESRESHEQHSDSLQKESTHDEYNVCSTTRGILRIPPTLRRDRERIQSDSDRSSIRGSILEEEHDGCEASSGECTPTEGSGDEKQLRIQNNKYSSNTIHDIPRYSEYNGRDKLSGNKFRRFSGGVAVDCSKTGRNKTSDKLPSGQQTTRVSIRNDSLRPYKPPAMRVSGKNNDGIISDDVRESSKLSSMQQSQKMADFPVYHEILRNEGPRMQEINDSITSLLQRVKKRDVKAAEKVIKLSEELCEIYSKLLLRDISFTFTMNLEQHLWKQAFYKSIEVFKSVANSPKDISRTFRDYLLILLTNGITYYEHLLDLYEDKLNMDLDKIVLFSFDRSDAFWSTCSSPNISTPKDKVAAKSYSRHLISLGDLKRYKILIEGSEDYSEARAMYLRSAQLWPSSGHCYNQLAVVAYFSMLYRSRRRARNTPLEILSNKRQSNALDEIFYCVRALSAGHPFEVARDRLYARLAAMKRKVDKYEPVLDHECGEIKEDAELAESADRPYELWLYNEGSDIETNDGDEHIFRSFLDQQPCKLHRRAISYLINTVGLLITKIGMESFPSVSERAIAQLAALVEQESSPVTAGQLIQIAALFIYAVHCNAIVGDDDVCSVQQQQAVRTLISVFGALLRPISFRLDQVYTWIKQPAEVPYVVTRALPALCVLCEWFSCPLASAIYRTMPSVEPLTLSIIGIDTWHLLAEIANELIRWQDCGDLVKIVSSTDALSCVLPELAFISSFSSVFPPFPRILRYTYSSPDSIETMIPIQIRLAQLLLAAEYLDGSELSCFFFCKKLGKFTRSEHADGSPREQSKVKLVEDTEESQSIPPPLTREELLEREIKKHEQLLVVKPLYVVIDTNVFIHQLEAVQKIVQCERFRVLIPTTVMTELLDLEHGDRDEDDSHIEAVTRGARQAMSWIREQTQQKTFRLFTLTMRGIRVPIVLGREIADIQDGMVNDDRILHSCLNFTQVEPVSEVLFNNFEVPQAREIPIIYRNVVLLTDDRVLNMKAMTHHIPCRTMVRFLKWAKIS